ncbi:rhodanese-like domain-containing protein [Vibrio hangzhouensis]|uniref:rhodanese-like domain-containing protein n=1 Tax=Vibrio hangzhouensis TaxID=462991 RepID=UPI001C96FD66|nr:rhodanese-like domain-containing protein [Vibrio hangzhouensis]MBY6198305.1 rhodanese-like domain-containing protein [Vibrio hangzhouensis]
MSFANQSLTSSASVEAKSKSYFIDVRSPQEFAAGHIEGSINVPLQMIFSLANSDLSQDDELVVYCASGMRSSQAAEALLSLGYRNVVNARTLNAAFEMTSC